MQHNHSYAFNSPTLDARQTHHNEISYWTEDKFSRHIMMANIWCDLTLSFQSVLNTALKTLSPTVAMKVFEGLAVFQQHIKVVQGC
jgi:hypothetical protein